MKQAEQTDNLKKNEVYNVRKSIILVHIFRNFFLHFRTLQRNQTSNVPLSNTWFSDVLNKTYKSIFLFSLKSLLNKKKNIFVYEINRISTY